ncbi:MAG: hydroxymethylbilane synthase [Alphaproteobacteria bacterium]|nr:hydroxymethylbilane synthase [Alphaproteobacteria bacterium]
MTTQRTRIRLGTRGSPLALIQTREVHDRLIAAHPELAAPGAVETVVIRTTGDRVQDRTLAEIGGKGLFTKEIEEALLAGTIDVAVHSMKDVPTFLPDGLEIDCLLPREDPRDAFICPNAPSLAALPAGALVGTASLRRQTQILNRRPDLKVAPLRGNVDTRLRKLEAGECAATVLALAGLRRLGRADVVTAVLEPEEMLPAVAQGAIGLECRTDDRETRRLLGALNDGPTSVCIAAERALLAALDGSCRTPIAALATLNAGALSLRGLVISLDGRQCHWSARQGAPADAARMGTEAGEELKRLIGPDFFEA